MAWLAQTQQELAVGGDNSQGAFACALKRVLAAGLTAAEDS
jgi:hypothetical protein